MSEDAELTEAKQQSSIVQPKETSGKSSFLKSSETSQMILDGLKLDGFQLGGGGINFSLGRYRREHEDVDMVYIVDSITWEEYLQNPKQVPEERQSLQNITQEPEFFKHAQFVPKALELQGAPGLSMTGPELPTQVDFVEAYRHRENNKEYIMLPIYEGKSYVKIPAEEVISSEIEGIKTHTVSPEVLYLMKEQASGYLRTIKGGPPPDRRPKSKQDIEELKDKVDMNKVERLKKEGIGFNFSPLPAARFRVTKLIESLVG